MQSKRFTLFKAISIWLIGALFVSYQFLLQASTGVLTGSLLHSLHTDISTVGLIAAGFIYSYMLLQVPAGMIADRFGPKWIMVLGYFFLGIATLVFAHVHTGDGAIAARLMMGVASAPAVVCAMSLSARWFKSCYFALLAGLVEAIGMMGGAAGEAGLGHLLTHYLWRDIMTWFGFIGIIMAILSMVWVKNAPAEHQPCIPDAEEYESHHVLCNLIKMLKRIDIWLPCLYSGFIFCTVGAFASMWVVPFLAARYGLPADQVGGLAAFVFFGTAIGSVIFGWLNVRFCALRLWLNIGAIGMLALLFIVLFLPLAQNEMVLALFWLGFFSGSYILGFAIVKQRVALSEQATAMGLTNMVCIGLSPLILVFCGELIQQCYQHVQIAVCHIISLRDYQIGMLPIVGAAVFAVILASMMPLKRSLKTHEYK